MRLIAILALIPLLVLCPILCGAADSVHAMHLLGTWLDPTAEPPPPDRDLDSDCCPDDGDSRPQDDDDCLCKGAIQVDGSRTSDGDRLDFAPALDGLPLADHPATSRLLAHLTRFGFPIGWASQAGACRRHAALQNFRC